MNIHAAMLEAAYRITINRSSSGTCFTLSKDSKNYLITAKHVIGDAIGKTPLIEVEADSGIVTISPTSIIAPTNNEVDIIALEIDSSTAKNLKFFNIPYTSKGVILCGDSYFIGYPFGLQNYNVSGATRGLPLIKKGMVSGSVYDMTKNPIGFLLDGHNNPGFSGGPCFIQNQNNEWFVFGVISSYVPQKEVLYDKQGRERMVILENSGIINSHNIDQIYSLL